MRASTDARLARLEAGRECPFCHGTGFADEMAAGPLIGALAADARQTLVTRIEDYRRRMEDHE